MHILCTTTLHNMYACLHMYWKGITLKSIILCFRYKKSGINDPKSNCLNASCSIMFTTNNTFLHIFLSTFKLKNNPFAILVYIALDV